MPNQQLHFTLDIDANEYLKYYSGAASTVHTITHEGVSIAFPAINLKSFVTRSGVTGTFVIEYDGENHLKNLRRIE